MFELSPSPVAPAARLPKKDQIWQRSNAEREAARIRESLRRASRQLGIPVALEQAERQVRRLSRRSDWSSQLLALLGCLELLRFHRDHGGLSRDAIQQTTRLARTILEGQGIHPPTSRLSFLHGELHRLASDLLADGDEGWAAAWERLVGDYKSRRPTRLWLSADALLGLPRFSPLDRDPGCPVERIRGYRLTGQLDRAREAALAFADGPEGKGDAALAAQWEITCLDATETGEIDRLARLARRGLPHHRPRWLLELALWTKAARTLAWLKAVPSVRTIRRLSASHPSGAAASLDDERFCRVVESLETCYRADLPLPQRLERLGTALREGERLDTPERQLLLWAAAGRWLVRVKQDGLAAAAIGRYRALGGFLSSGRTADVLGVLADLPPAYRLSPAPAPDAHAARVPVGKLARFGEISRMSAAVAFEGGRNWLSPRSRRADNLGPIRIVTRYSGRLKGPLMKLGQWASYSAFGVSDEAAEILGGLQDGAEPLAAETVRAIVAQELRCKLSTAFPDWDDRPLGTGSVGQVHRARTRDGAEVVVKVQYPEIESAMANDVFCASLLKPLFRRILPHWEFHLLLRELRARMLDECDYVAEAASQIRLRALCAQEPAIWVPRVWAELSTRRVLTSEYVPGVSLPEFARQAPLEERSRAAEILARSHWRNVFRDRFFNSDPHPGNFLVCGDRLAMVDFGSAKDLAPRSWLGLRQVMESFLLGDREMFLCGMRNTRMFSSERFDAAAMYERMGATLLGFVMRDEPVELTRAMALDYLRQCTVDNPEFYREVHVTDECLLLFRAHWGLFGTLGLLRPRVNWRRAYLDSVAGLDPVARG